MIEAHHACAIDDKALQLAGKTNLNLLLNLEGEHFGDGIGRPVVLRCLDSQLYLIAARRRGRARKLHLAVFDSRGKTLGVLALGVQEVHLRHQLISMRYEQRSTIITTNVGIGGWGNVFGDEVAASAIADRMRHHCSMGRLKEGPTGSRICRPRREGSGERFGATPKPANVRWRARRIYVGSTGAIDWQKWHKLY